MNDEKFGIGGFGGKGIHAAGYMHNVYMQERNKEAAMLRNHSLSPFSQQPGGGAGLPDAACAALRRGTTTGMSVGFFLVRPLQLEPAFCVGVGPQQVDALLGGGGLD